MKDIEITEEKINCRCIESFDLKEVFPSNRDDNGDVIYIVTASRDISDTEVRDSVAKTFSENPEIRAWNRMFIINDIVTLFKYSGDDKFILSRNVSGQSDEKMSLIVSDDYQDNLLKYFEKI